MKTRKAKRLTSVSEDWNDGAMLIHEIGPGCLSNLLISKELQSSSVTCKSRYETGLLSNIYMTLWVSPMKFPMKTQPFLIFRTKDILPTYGGAMNPEWYGTIDETSESFHSMKNILSWVDYTKLHHHSNLKKFELKKLPEVIVKTNRIPLSKLY